VLSAVVFLRQARCRTDGLVVLLLAGGWVLITYQNWQSDPHWTVIAGLILFPLSRDIELYNQFGWPLKKALRFVAVGLLTVGLPLSYAQIMSVVVHKGLDSDRFEIAFKPSLNAGLWFEKPGAGRIKATVDNPSLGGQTDKASETKLGTEVLAECRSPDGLLASLKAIGAGLDQLEYTAGKTALFADWGNGLWLFSNVKPLPGGAPWYYGGAPGFENAELVVVPLCPALLQNRRLILDEINKDPTLNFREVMRNKLFILLEKTR